MAIAKPGKYYFLMMCIVGSITIVASCKNKDLPLPVGLKAQLNVFNATGDTIKFFINGTRQNNFTPIFIGGATGYLSVLSGEQSYRFSKSNEGFPTLFTTSFNLTDSTYYSIFVGGEAANQAFKIKDPIDSLLAVIAADTTTATSVNAFVRYVNATPGADKFEITVGGGDTVNFKGYAFGTWSKFKPFISGTKKVRVYVNGSDTAKIDTSVIFTAGIGYTLFTHGQSTGKGGNALAVGVIPNVQ
jgi:hypothetical protein